MKVYMFPGQGSQIVGMGASLFQEFPEVVRIANEILGYSLQDLCSGNPKGALDQTQYTQPAIYVVNALAYYKQSRLAVPDILIGHSLGEINALHAADCFDFQTGLRIVQKRGQLMSHVSGGMLAVMKISHTEVQRLLDTTPNLSVRIAIYNGPEQTVIAGNREHLERIQPVLERNGAACILLNTSGPFHTDLMRNASQEFAKYLEDVPFLKPKIPVVANVSAIPYGDRDLKENLRRQLMEPVRWLQSIEYLRTLGQPEFTEVGQGNVLTKILEKIPTGGDKPAAKEFVRWCETEAALRCHASADKVDLWNRQYSSGTTVAAEVLEGRRLRTRTPALLLFGHRAAVYLENYQGYFDLDELRVSP